jgi:PAS domain S-box-containing protein
MSDAPRGAAGPDPTRLMQELEAMSSTPEAAVAFLSEIAGALFPEGGRPEQLTWPDAGAGRSPASPLDEQAQAEAKLRAAEARYRTLVEQIPAVTFMAVLGEGRNEIYISPHIESMLGFTQEEWLGNPFLWYTQLHPDDRDLWNAEFARGCRTGGPFRAECRFLARDGRVVWVHGEARLVKDDIGRPLFLQGVAFDITESKRAQEVLLTDAVRRAKAEEELAIARRVQTSILPKTFAVEGLEIAAAMRPADDVGGDYYDVLAAPGGCWLAIGDVSGHGLDSGLIMLMVQSAMSALTRSDADATPRGVVCQLNELLFENIRQRLGHDDHVTLTLLRYSRNGRLVFAGAHEEMLVLRRETGVIEPIPTPGTWLGARKDIRKSTVDSVAALRDGDVLVLYTDGITEAMNAAHDQFGLERLAAAVYDMPDAPVEAIRDNVLRAVGAWMSRQADDMSLVVARYHEPGSTRDR